MNEILMKEVDLTGLSMFTGSISSLARGGFFCGDNCDTNGRQESETALKPVVM